MLYADDVGGPGQAPTSQLTTFRQFGELWQRGPQKENSFKSEVPRLSSVLHASYNFVVGTFFNTASSAAP
jgi:hypothetical protein